MIHPKFKMIFPQVLLWAAVAALSGQTAVAQDANQTATAPVAGQRSDGQIEMDVVHALDASKALKNDLLTAATIQSEVTLSGTVSNLASSELAESIVSGIPGVTKVHNNLKIGNPQAAQEATTGDANAQQMADDAQPEAAAAAPLPGPQDGPMPVPNPAERQSQVPAPQQPQSQQAQRDPQPVVPVNEQAAPPVTVVQGTLLKLRTSEPVNSKSAKNGNPVQFTVIQDVTAGGVLAIPRGATVHGVVTEVKKTNSGELTGKSELSLTLTSLDLGGHNYPLSTDEFKVKGPGKGGQTAASALTGGLIGTMIGCAAGRGVGCAIGAGAGVAAGTAASAASSGPGVWIPSEALVDFHLAAPLTVTPVNAQEAARLAQGLYPGGPTLYRRGYGPEGPYARPYYGGNPYDYPPVYYRPYYVTGGYYYWR